ncbi:hypothetical protein U9M48_012645, partial [Paspalum notatum var. saurae]
MIFQTKKKPQFLSRFKAGMHDIGVGEALCNLGKIYNLQDKFAQAQTCYE